MNGIAAKHLRDLFTAAAGTYPRLEPIAEIKVKTAGESEISFTAKTPAEAAAFLQHLVNHDGQGVFDRSDLKWQTQYPVIFRMNKKVRLKADHKEAHMLAFNMNFREFDKPCHLWLSDPKMNDYHWHGDERIENKPPMTFDGPTIKTLIAVLNSAGDEWHDVNFMNVRNNGLGKKPNLRLV